VQRLENSCIPTKGKIEQVQHKCKRPEQRRGYISGINIEKKKLRLVVYVDSYAVFVFFLVYEYFSMFQLLAQKKIGF